MNIPKKSEPLKACPPSTIRKDEFLSNLPSCRSLIIQAVFDIENIDDLSENISWPRKREMKEAILKEYCDKLEREFFYTRASADKIAKLIKEVEDDDTLSEVDKLLCIGSIKSHSNILPEDLESKAIDTKETPNSEEDDFLLEVDNRI